MEAADLGAVAASRRWARPSTARRPTPAPPAWPPVGAKVPAAASSGAAAPQIRVAVRENHRNVTLRARPPAWAPGAARPTKLKGLGGKSANADRADLAATIQFIWGEKRKQCVVCMPNPVGYGIRRCHSTECRAWNGVFSCFAEFGILNEARKVRILALEVAGPPRAPKQGLHLIQVDRDQTIIQHRSGGLGELI